MHYFGNFDFEYCTSNTQGNTTDEAMLRSRGKKKKVAMFVSPGDGRVRSAAKDEGIGGSEANFHKQTFPLRSSEILV